MAATVNAILKNNDNNKQLLIRGLKPIRHKKSQPSVNIPFINSKPENNFLFRFTGQQRSISLTLWLFDDGTDVSNGTHSSTVITVEEQIKYIMDEIYTEDYDVDWDLTQTRHLTAPITGVIDDIDIDDNSGPNAAVVNILFKEGRIGSI